jgi:ketosteroid isomerase-like protein/CheY-like chemotaxis protein
MPARPDSPQVLVYDEDDDLRDALEDFLGEYGYRVLTARAGREAASLLERHDVHAVLVGIRVHLPEVWKEVADLREAAQPAPVGMLTGWRLPPEDAAASRASFILEKPFDGQDLLARLSEWIPSSAPKEVTRLVNAYFEALGNRRWDSLAELCTQDVRYHLPGNDPRFSRTVNGRAAFRDFSEETFRDFKEARFEVRALLPLPNGAVARYQGSWAAPTGERQELPGSVVFRVREGRISEIGIRLEYEKLGRVS